MEESLDGGHYDEFILMFIAMVNVCNFVPGKVPEFDRLLSICYS